MYGNFSQFPFLLFKKDLVKMMGKCGKEEQKKKGVNRVKTAVRVLFKFVFCLLNGRNLTFFFFLTDIKKNENVDIVGQLQRVPSFPKSQPGFPKSLPVFPKSLLDLPKSPPGFSKSLPRFPNSLRGKLETAWSTCGFPNVY